jgi:glutamate synthase domain-containing protein 2
MRLPFLAGSSGAMETAPESGNYLAIGAALSGVSVVCEEDVCGADPGLELDSHGRVETAPGMARRVERYRRYHQGSGEMIVQMNAEDVRLGVAEYAISRLGIECIEFTWGRSARCFDGEVRMDSLRQALELQRRGYLVIPDPSHPTNRAAFNAGVLTRFIRHSRLGFVDQDGFMNRVDRVRRLGARRVALRAGICSTRELALVIRWASDAELDLLTIDGAPGGAAMGPRWMTEQWGVPTLYLQSVTCDLCRQLAACGRFVPDIAVAGGFNSEDHFFKVLAMGAPYTRAICMSPGPMVPGTAGSSVGQWLDERPEGLRKITSLFGVTIEDILACHEELVAKHGRQTAGRLPLGAVALYAYSRRIGTGLRRLMADSGNATVSTITRDDVTALTPEAAQVFGLAAP